MTTLRRPHSSVATLAVALTLSLAGINLPAQRAPSASTPGMPDLSGAPADVQAIWKKLTSGVAPTEAEGKRLSDWMEANKDKIVKATTAKMGAATRGTGSARISAASDRPQCPTKTLLPPSLSIDPTAAAATALLDSLRQSYTAQLDSKSAPAVEALVRGTVDPAQLNLMGGAFYAKGFVAPAVLAFVAEVLHSSSVEAPRSWSDLGAALIGAGDAMHAVRAVRRAMTLGGRTVPQVTNLGVAYADLGDLATATTLLSEATRRSPAWAPAWDALSRVQSCDGNKVLAMHAMQKAQDADWDDSRQDALDQAEQNGSRDSQNAQSDAVEAAKPLPEPPGRSPFPSTGASEPGYFDAWSPKIAGTWQEQAKNLVFDTKMATEYRGLQTQILGERDKPVVTHGPPGGASSGTALTFAISNGSQATHGAQLADHRAGARMSMILSSWRFSDSVALAQGIERAGPILEKKQSCDATARAGEEESKCFVPYCTSMQSLAEQEYGQLRGVASTFLGGVAGLSQTYTTVMDRWFDWAGDPESRRSIDRRRRTRLAAMEEMAYMVSSLTQAGPPSACMGVKLTQSSKLAKAVGAAQRDEGECKSRSIHLPKFAVMDADCHHMTMTFDILDKIGTPTLDWQRASATQNGKFFFGFNKDAGDGSVSGTAGYQVTWDNGGWVQSSGPTIKGEMGVDGLVKLSGDMTVSDRSTGAPVSGSAALNVPMFGFAPSVSFGGK